MHSLIVGMTESGKTTLAKNLVSEYKKNGIYTIVLDILHDPAWSADIQCDNANFFLQTVKQSQNCAVFVDESGEVIGRYNDEMFWLATRSRHFGHNVYFITQRANQLAKTVRDQCSILYAFCMSFDDSKLLANEFNKEELKKCNKLKRFEYLYVPRFGKLEKCIVKHDFN